MRNTILIALFLGFGFSVSAQTVEKTIKLNNTSKLVYNVDESNNTKSGIYAIQNLKNNGVWLKGNYKNDTRVGLWYFFDSKNKLTMRYNYDQKKLAFIDTAALGAVSVNILSKDPEIVKNASAPLPLCSVDYMVALIAGKLNGGYGTSVAEITARVDAAGKATYSVSYVKDNKKTDKKKIDFDTNNFWIDWIPSMYNNKPVESEFTVYATLNGSNDSSAPASAVRRFRWDN